MKKYKKMLLKTYSLKVLIMKLLKMISKILSINMVLFPLVKDKEKQKSKGSGFAIFAGKKSAILAFNDADNLVCKKKKII